MASLECSNTVECGFKHSLKLKQGLGGTELNANAVTVRDIRVLLLKDEIR